MNDAGMASAPVDSTSDKAPAAENRTTDGTIALRNLDAQLAALEGRATSSPEDRHVRVDLIDLLAVRGQVLGCDADAERAAELAEQAVQQAPMDGLARLARARVRSDEHRFDEALTDLDAAEQLGMEQAAVDAERVAILHALGRSDEAVSIGRAAVARHPDFTSLAALAVLHAERGEVTDAEAVFAASLAQYRGVSPFPLAHLAVQRGRMWQRAGDVPTARTWFEHAVRRVPTHAPAQGLLAALDAATDDADDDRGMFAGSIGDRGTDDGHDRRR